MLDEDHYSVVLPHTDISRVLDDLGYGANDLMNVGFVFIVEGKQDKSRLPLLLERYYSEVYDEKGELLRISIITTNSCTNIKTYANLKYMNQVYPVSYTQRDVYKRQTYGRKGEDVVKKNWAAIDAGATGAHKVEVPESWKNCEDEGLDYACLLYTSFSL